MQLMQAAGNLEGPSNHPDDYETRQGLSMDVASQANGLTPSHRIVMDDKVQLLRINSRLFEQYQGLAGPGGAPQGPPRLVHMEGEDVRVARPANQPLVQSDSNGVLTGDRQVIQAYNTVHDTHQMAEDALGRPVRFNTPDGKLTVSLDDPRADMSGPRHDPTDGSIMFPRGNPASGGDPDVISHETGHAVLTSQRPQYQYDGHGGTGAVHEAYADVTSLTLALRDPDVRAGVLGNRDGTNIGSVVGEGMALHQQPRNPLSPDAPTDPHAGIRDLSKPGPPGDEAHDASQRYSGAIYHSILDVQSQLRKEHPDMSEDEALRQANEIVGGNALRSVDFMPVGPNATLDDMARATLKAGDRDQEGRYRGVLEHNFREAGIQVGGPADRLREAGYQAMGQNPALQMPDDLRQGEQFGPSLGVERPAGSGPGTAAEDYLKRNREALGLPEGVTYRAQQLLRNDRGETFVQFSDGASLTDPNNKNYLLLAFDREGRPIHLQDSQAPPPPAPMPMFTPGPWPAPTTQPLGIVA